MPRLVKGGKHVYGWSKVSNNGKVVVPDEAFTDYKFETPSKVIMMQGSKTSGGFTVTSPSMLQNSRLSVILDREPRLAEFQLQEGETVNVGTRIYCWVNLSSNREFVVPVKTLNKYGVNAGDMLLAVRGSGLALGFIVKGPIVAEAKKHTSLPVFK